MRKTIALLAGLALVSVACTDDGSGVDRTGRPDDRPGDTTDGRPDLSLDGDITFVAALRTVGDCDAVLDHLHTEAAARVGPYGLGQGGPIYYAEDSARSAAESDGEQHLRADRRRRRQRFGWRQLLDDERARARRRRTRHRED